MSRGVHDAWTSDLVSLLAIFHHVVFPGCEMELMNPAEVDIANLIRLDL